MIIGISGKKQHGKNTVASMIQFIKTYESIGSKPTYARWINWDSAVREGNLPNIPTEAIWHVKAYADKLKQLVATTLNCNVRNFEYETFKESKIPITFGNHTYREFLQIVGNKMREVHPDYWVNALLGEYHSNSKWLISDVRYPNEADAIIKLGGVIIRVERPIPVTDFHISETALDDYNNFLLVVKNNCNLETLFQTCSELCMTKL